MKKISLILFVFFFEQQQFLILFYISIGDNFDTQLSVGGSGENSRLTNYTAFMLGIVLPDSYSQSLANNYEWQSKVLNFHQHEVAYFLPSQDVQGGPLASLAVGQSDSNTFSATYVLTQADIDNGVDIRYSIGEACC